MDQKKVPDYAADLIADLAAAIAEREIARREADAAAALDRCFNDFELHRNWRSRELLLRSCQDIAVATGGLGRIEGPVCLGKQ